MSAAARWKECRDTVWGRMFVRPDGLNVLHVSFGRQARLCIMLVSYSRKNNNHCCTEQ